MVHAVVVRGELNGLGVVRSLARGGVPTTLADVTRLNAAAWSRFCRFRRVERLHGDELVRDLLDLARTLDERPVLILTDEMAVLTVSEHREVLSAAYRIELPSDDVVTMLIDKARFQEFAEANGLPVPRTALIRSEQDIARLGDLNYPVIVKPADKKQVYIGATERLHLIADQPQCEEVCRRVLRTAGELVVQEWIEGPDSDIFFTLFHCGAGVETLSIFSGRKTVCKPPGVGSTAFCIGAPQAAAELEALTRRFIALTAYRGLGSLEFKFDAVRQRFVVIEPTVGRTDWQEEIATLSGVNIPLAAYRSAVGLPPPEAAGAVRAGWQESILHWAGRFDMPAGTRVYDGYWRLADPAPAVVHYASALARRLRRLVAWPALRAPDLHSAVPVPAGLDAGFARSSHDKR
jgi:predicted ATP-grasp superfamily ATP-dependent carboligase